MKKNAVRFFCFLLVGGNFLAAQPPVEFDAKLMQISVVNGISESSLCRGSYWTWQCRKCGATNVQEASRCNSCGSSR